MKICFTKISEQMNYWSKHATVNWIIISVSFLFKIEKVGFWLGSKVKLNEKCTWKKSKGSQFMTINFNMSFLRLM